VVPTANGSLSEKRRKAAEARQKAMEIRVGVTPSRAAETQEENGKSDLSSATKFNLAREKLQNRVEAAKEPLQNVPAMGNVRALEWAKVALVESDYQHVQQDPSPTNVPNWLDWWRKNGKMLVAEKRGLSQSNLAHGDSTPKESLSVGTKATDYGVRGHPNKPVLENAGTKSTMSRREILAEKRRQIVEARMAVKKQQDQRLQHDLNKLNANNTEVTPEELANDKLVQSVDDAVEGLSLGPNHCGTDTGERKKRRELEAHRLAERIKEAREKRLAREAELEEISRNSNIGHVVEIAITHESSLDNSLNSGETAQATNIDQNATALPFVAEASDQKSINVKNKLPAILFPMVRETERLSGFIRRYETKLETVCKSLLAVVSEDVENREAVINAKQLPLPEMFNFIVQQEWYEDHVPAQAKPTSGPSLIFSGLGNAERLPPSKRDVRQEMESDKGEQSDDKIYTVTAVGQAFLHMDGPIQADIGRFLAHLHNTQDGLRKKDMVENWKQIALLSGDAQSQRVYEKLDEIISFCLDSHIIK
jgi:hypothetical protein